MDQKIIYQQEPNKNFNLKFEIIQSMLKTCLFKKHHRFDWKNVKKI